MKTKVLRLNPSRIDKSLILAAAKVIKNGGLVSFPTETVYGLGADAFNPDAVAEIFAAKGRPFNDPLIVHIADKKDVLKLSVEAHKAAMHLADKFWPGPLTLVLKKSPKIPSLVTAGLGTVAVRMPDNGVALSLIKAAGTPIAAPSANLFGRPSPTSACHVLDDLEGRVDLILDSGKTTVGIESTVLDLTSLPFRILRPGGISLEVLRSVMPGIKPYRGNKISSPGMFKRHYSPKARLILVEKKGKPGISMVRSMASEFAVKGYRVGIIAKEENRRQYGSDLNVKVLGPSENLSFCAANLFAVLREFDKEGTQLIISESVKEEGLGVAVMDRLRRAAARGRHV